MSATARLTMSVITPIGVVLSSSSPAAAETTDPAGSATAWVTVHEPVHAPRLRPGVICDVARLPERFDRADEVADLARTARLL